MDSTTSSLASKASRRRLTVKQRKSEETATPVKKETPAVVNPVKEETVTKLRLEKIQMERKRQGTESKSQKVVALKKTGLTLPKRTSPTPPAREKARKRPGAETKSLTVAPQKKKEPERQPSPTPPIIANTSSGSLKSRLAKVRHVQRDRKVVSDDASVKTASARAVSHKSATVQAFGALVTGGAPAAVAAPREETRRQKLNSLFPKSASLSKSGSSDSANKSPVQVQSKKSNGKASQMKRSPLRFEAKTPPKPKQSPVPTRKSPLLGKKSLSSSASITKASRLFGAPAIPSSPPRLSKTHLSGETTKQEDEPNIVQKTSKAMGLFHKAQSFRKKKQGLDFAPVPTAPAPAADAPDWDAHKVYFSEFSAKKKRDAWDVFSGDLDRNAGFTEEEKKSKDEEDEKPRSLPQHPGVDLDVYGWPKSPLNNEDEIDPVDVALAASENDDENLLQHASDDYECTTPKSERLDAYSRKLKDEESLSPPASSSSSSNSEEDDVAYVQQEENDNDDDLEVTKTPSLTIDIPEPILDAAQFEIPQRSPDPDGDKEETNSSFGLPIIFPPPPPPGSKKKRKKKKKKRKGGPIPLIKPPSEEKLRQWTENRPFRELGTPVEAIIEESLEQVESMEQSPSVGLALSLEQEKVPDASRAMSLEQDLSLEPASSTEQEKLQETFRDLLSMDQLEQLSSKGQDDINAKSPALSLEKDPSLEQVSSIEQEQLQEKFRELQRQNEEQLTSMESVEVDLISEAYSSVGPVSPQNVPPTVLDQKRSPASAALLFNDAKMAEKVDMAISSASSKFEEKVSKDALFEQPSGAFVSWSLPKEDNEECDKAVVLAENLRFHGRPKEAKVAKNESVEVKNGFEPRESRPAFRRFIVPDEFPSPFEILTTRMPSFISHTLAFLGDPVAVCKMKMVNKDCQKYITENEYPLIRDAVRAGGMSINVRPYFWLWVTLEKCPSELDDKTKGKVDLLDLEKQGIEGKWHNIIERDVSRSFGNLPPHKTGARLRTDSIVRALVSWGRCRMIKRGVKGESSLRQLDHEEGDQAPTDTVSDWGGVAPVGSFASLEMEESVPSKSPDAQSVDGKSVDGDLALSGNTMTEDEKSELQRKLSLILHCLAASNEDVGYCQGMDYVVAHLLRILQETIRWKGAVGSMPDIVQSAPKKLLSKPMGNEALATRFEEVDNSLLTEETCFRVMECFFSTYSLRHFYYPELRCLKTCCRVFERLIQLKLPVLADHFEHHELNVGLFALGWFQTLFLYLPSMPSATVCHMWDIWVVERSFKIFFRVGTAILFLSQPILLNHELEGMMSYLNTFPDATLLSPDILIACALQIKVTNKMLMDIENQVAAENEGS